MNNTLVYVFPLGEYQNFPQSNASILHEGIFMEPMIIFECLFLFSEQLERRRCDYNRHCLTRIEGKIDVLELTSSNCPSKSAIFGRVAFYLGRFFFLERTDDFKVFEAK